MTDTVRPSGGASSELRRTIWPWSTDIPLLSADPFNLDARLVIGGQEYVRCTGRSGFTLTGCVRGLSPEDGGSGAKYWPGGTSVDQMPWDTTEVVTVYPTTPTLAMVGRDFAWDAGDGNVYRYHVVLIEGAPVVIWDDEPPEAADAMMFLWASQITGLTSISGVALDGSGNIYVAATSGGNGFLAKYNASFVSQWTQTGLVTGLAHAASDGTTLFVSRPTGNTVLKRSATTGGLGSPATIGSLGSGNGQFASGGPMGAAFDGTNLWVVDTGNNRVQKFTASTGAYVSQFGGLTAPTGITLAASKLYVLNAGVGEVRRYNATTHALEVTLTLGSGTVDGQISTTAEGVAVDSTGRIWIADTGNHRIQVFDSAGLFLGKVGSFGSGSSEFKSPKQLAVGSGDVIYVADSGNNRLVTVQEDVSGATAYSGGPYIIFTGKLESVSGVANREWTNMPSASTELYGATQQRRLIDLSNLTQYRYTSDIAVAGSASAVLNLEYTTDLTGATGWTSMAGGTLSLVAVAIVFTGWANIPTLAKAVVLLRVVGSGGNATADPSFQLIAAQFQ